MMQSFCSSHSQMLLRSFAARRNAYGPRGTSLRIPARAEQANAVVRYILQGGKTNMKTWNKPEIEVIDVAMTMTGSKPAEAEKIGAEADKYYAKS